MAAILKLRRGTSIPSLVESELFFNQTNKTIVFGDGSTQYTLVKVGINTGSVQFTGDITATNLTLSGNATVSGNITFGGSLITLGDANTDNIVISGELSSSLIPNNDAAFDLGSLTKRYKSIYAVSASFQNVSLPSTGILSSSIQDFDTYSSSIESQLDSVYIFTQSADQRLTSIEVFTQSVDLRVTDLESSQSYFDNTFSGSVDSRLVNLEFTGSDHESRIDVIETTFSSSVDLRLDNAESTGSDHESRVIDLESTGSDHETRISAIEGYSSSLDSRLDDLEQTGSNHEFRIDNLELSQSYFDNTFSGSVDSRLDNLEFTGSNHELRIIDLESTGSDHETRISSIEGYSSSLDLRLDLLENFSSSEYQIDSSSFNSRLDVIETTFSTSVDLRLDDLEFTGSDHESRLDIIEGPLSESINQQLTSIHSYTSSLKNAIEVSGQNLTVFGDLIVEGTTTTINTQELLIEDKLLAIASGSITSFEADGGGFFISGANASILWNHLDQTIDFNTKVSSSVGFKGDGSELTNVPFTGIIFDGSGLVSGSSQIDLTQTTNYISGIKTRLNTENVFSSSIQVNADDITNFDTNVKDVLNDDLVHSGSYLGTATTSDLDEGIRLYYTDSRVKNKLNSEGVISGSSQIINGSNIVSSSEQISNYGVFAELLGDNLVSGSSQISSSLTSNWISDVKDRLNAENVISGSLQVTESLDNRYLKINGDGVISGSDQVTASLDIRYLEINGDSVFSGSSQVNITQTSGYTSFSSSIDGRLDLLEGDQHTHLNKVNLDVIDQDLATTDKPTFENINLPNLTSLPTGSEFSVLLYSQSGEITYSELGTAAYYHVSQSISNGDQDVIGNAKAVKDYIDEQLLIIGAGDITAVIAGDGMSGGAESGPATLTLDTASLHFTNGIASSLPSGLISGSTFTDFSSSVDTRLDSLELFSSSLDNDFVTQTELASATGSLINSIGTKLDTGSYNTDSSSFDSRLDTLEGETHENPLTFSSTSTIEFVRNIDTITSNVIGGIVSSSAQISGYNTFLEINGDSVVSGSSQISFNGIVDKPTLVSGSSQIDIEQTTNFTTFSSSLDSRLDSLETDQHTHSNKSNLDTINQNLSTTSNVTFNHISSSGNIVPTQSGLSLGSPTQPWGDLWLSGFTLNIGNKSISEANLVTTQSLQSQLPPGSVSGSSQVVATSTSGFTSGIKTRLNAEGVISGSDQLTGSLVDLISDQTISGTKTFNDIIVNGTGSFSYIQSTTGSAKIIGDAFIILNNDTPTERYAGIKVYDSGSVNTTASLQFDGQTNDWFYQYSDDGGATTDHGVVLFGPEYSGIGNPTYPTNNTIQKGNGGHHLLDSNITDDGSIITLGSNTTVTGTLSATTYVGVVSGSSQITLGGDVTGNATTNTVERIQGVAITSGEATQIANINSITISNTQWGYLGTLNQPLTQTSTVQFGKVGVGGASDATYELKVTGDIGATGDVVAFVSSDERLKDNITPIPNSLQKINSIGGYSFVWNEKQDIYKGKDYGVIAQEIENILPELVETRENGYKAVKYDRIVSLLIEGIKELSKEVSELKEKIGK